MNENASRHEIVAPVPLVEHAPEGMQIAALDDIVGMRVALELQSGDDGDTAFEEAIEARLAQNGIIDSDENARQHDEYNFAKGVYRHVAQMNTVEWLTSPKKGDMARRNIVLEATRDFYVDDTSSEIARNVDSVDIDDSHEDQPEGTEVEAEAESESESTTSRQAETEAARQAIIEALEVSRDDFATKSAKRQARAFGRGGESYETAEQEYFANVQEVGRLTFEDDIARQNEMTDDEKQALNVKVIEYLFAEQKALRDQTTEKLRGTKLNKFVEFMNRGSLKTRIAKGVGLGLVAGATGAFIAGAAGAAVVGAGAVGASRFVRGYVAHEKDIGSDEYTHENQKQAMKKLDESERVQTVEDYLVQGGNGFRKWHEKDTHAEQNKRKKALAWGVGSVAVGAALGYGMHAAAEYLSDKDMTLFGNHDVDAQPNNTDTAPTDQPDADNETDTDTDTNDNGEKTPPSAPDPSEDDGSLERADPEAGEADGNAGEAHELADVEAAYHVHRGEGWYNTFDEMGIPYAEWDTVLEDAGPELEKQGWAYFDETHNEWRISQPGTLPESAMNVIKDTSTKHGYDLTV